MWVLVKVYKRDRPRNTLAKRHMKNGLRGNWKFNSLKKVLQEKSFFHILKKYRDEDISKDNTKEVFSDVKGS